MKEKKRILIVEDDAALNNGIVLSLNCEEYQMVQAFCIEDARRALGMGEVPSTGAGHVHGEPDDGQGGEKPGELDLILLDINLPDGDGLSLCREIRKRWQTPIIFLTANDMEIDVVAGFETGGDDYITKPFSLAILRARVAALLRRGGQAEINRTMQIDDFNFDFEHMRFTKAGRELILSKTEQKLLWCLVAGRGGILSREVLFEKIWNEGYEFVDENALTVTVSRLRSKLEDNPAEPRYIKTVYGLGYAWEGGRRD